MTKVNLSQKLAEIDEPWSPRRVGRVNDTDIRIVKLHGEFVWHHHERYAEHGQRAQ